MGAGDEPAPSVFARFAATPRFIRSSGASISRQERLLATGTDRRSVRFRGRSAQDSARGTRRRSGDAIKAVANRTAVLGFPPAPLPVLPPPRYSSPDYLIGHLTPALTALSAA